MTNNSDAVRDPMPSLIERLLQRFANGESVELEFKSAKGGLPKSIWETISAFANTKGGWVMLGVVERDSQLLFEGVTNAHAQLKSLFDLMRNHEKISHPVCGTDDISIERDAEREYILLRVPAAQRKARPVYINHDPYTGTFLRRHEGDYRASKPEVDRMMREASDSGADSALLKHYGLDDIDRDSLARYRRRYQTLHPDEPPNGYDDLSFLTWLNGYRRVRETGEEGLTAAGLLMFGAAAAIREWRTRHLIDYRLKTSQDADIRWDDRVEWEGNLFGAFETLSPRLVRDQPVPFLTQGNTRVAEGPIHAALREALMNLLVHADYSESQVSLIQHTSEGYSFRNPGSSRVPEDDLFIGNRSDPRNPELVRMFRYIGLVEEAGTGIPKIVQTWRKLGLQMPRIEVGTERYEFTLELRHAHLLSEDDRMWLSTIGTNWSEAEQLALVCARHEDGVDNLRLRQLAGLHAADATKVLSNLRARDYLEIMRRGRSASYRLGRAALDEHRSADQADIWEHAGQSPPATLSTNLGGNGPNLGGNGPNLGGNGPESLQDEPELQRLSVKAHQRQRMTPVERDALIVQMCAIRQLSPQELSELLGRSYEYVRKILAPLVADGRLVYQYPSQPNHPHQRYITKERVIDPRSARNS